MSARIKKQTHCFVPSVVRQKDLAPDVRTFILTVTFALRAGHPLSGRSDRLSGERFGAGGRGAAGGASHQGRL